MKKKIIIVCLVLLLCTAVCAGCVPVEFTEPAFKTPDLTEGAVIVSETLKKGEKADAQNLLDDSNKYWTPQDPDRKPRDNEPEVCNSVVEIKLKQVSTFNTAVIREAGSEVQYFRLQVLSGDGWVTVYKSEKIESLRLLSFDTVTTDRVRLSIDKFRSKNKPAKIKSLELYNESDLRRDGDFNVTAYQRLDGDVPSEVLKGTEEEVKNYARYYDVYNTILIFGAVGWDLNGDMDFFVKDGEEGFARELEALKQIISHRSDKTRDVKIICTVLPDGTGGGHDGVNLFMKEHWESICAQMLDFMKKYDLDGLDIDWEYPRSKSDWDCYNKFITRLDDGMKAIKSDAVLSGALSAWSLGMSTEVLARFDQIQFMAYDGRDEDGFQSSLEQAQAGLLEFLKKGAKLSQINIGIAAYGRPLNSAPYWATWRDLDSKDMYWNSKHYNVECEGQVFDATFCAPALAGDKTAYALMSGAGGVMVFRLACDKTMDDPDAVSCGIENTLKRYNAVY